MDNNKQYELIKLMGENEYYSWYSYAKDGYLMPEAVFYIPKGKRREFDNIYSEKKKKLKVRDLL